MSTSTTQKPTTRRIVGMVVGIVIIGLGIALFKQSHLGNDSISALNMRLAELLGISLGVQNVATNILFFALEFWFGRKYIGLGTFVNGIGMGFIITFFYDPIAAAFGPAASLPEQLVWVVLAVLVTALGASSTRRLTSALHPTITSRWVCGTTRTSSISAAASSPTPSAPCSAGSWAVSWVWAPSSARSASDPSSSSSTASSPSGSCSISPKKHEHNEKDICRRQMSFVSYSNLNSGVPVEMMPPAMIWSFGRSSALVTMTALSVESPAARMASRSTFSRGVPALTACPS